MTEVVVSPLQGTGNNLKRRLGASDMLLDEASPSPAPMNESNIEDRVKRIKMDSEEFGSGFGGHRAANLNLGGINWNVRENLTNSMCREFQTTNDEPTGKKARCDLGMRFDHSSGGSSSSSSSSNNEDIFSAANSNKLREGLYANMERQMSITQEKMKKMEVELQAQKVLSHRLLGKLQEKEEERRVLIKGVTIGDNRNRELQLQVQDLHAESQRSRCELSHAQRENSQLQLVLQSARDYILRIERQLHGQKESEMHVGSPGGDGFMPPAPPDVF